MRLDALARIIDAFEFYQLREVSLKYLSLLGYQNPALTDGWSDGGTDLRLLRTDGLDSTIVIQVSVERKWESKLRSDIAKAVRNYRPATFIFISSRRIPELRFNQIATEFRAQGLSLIKADSQALASSFYENNNIAYLLQVAGLNDVQRPSMAPRPNFKEDAAYAYLFLSGNVRDFRAAVLEHALLSRVVEKREKVTHAQLVEDLSIQLGLRENQKDQVSSAVDRLLMKGDLVSQQGKLKVRSALRDDIIATRTLADGDWVKLKEKLTLILDRYVTPSQQGRVDGDRLLGSIGSALATASALTRTEVVSGERGARSELLPRLRERLQQLFTLLSEVGIADAVKRHEVVGELVAEASNAPAGQALAAAELFLVLSGLDISHLARALGMAQVPPIILDASVAIPMFTALLYQPAATRYSFASSQLYQQAKSHDAPLRIPQVYLEEAATHLIEAWTDYLPLVEKIDDLKNSTNAYVAHFSSLRAEGKCASFISYVKGLGINPGILNGSDYSEIRRIVMRLLGNAMGRYGISITFEAPPRADRLKEAQEEVSYVSHESGLNRSTITLRHDANVIAQLDGIPGGTCILCSWDRLFLDHLDNSSRSWPALDPSALCDLMALAAGSTPGERPMLISPVSWARSLEDEDLKRASEIWDWMARNEKTNLMDAQLLDSAREFVTEYVAATKSTRPHEIDEAWTAWKNSHSPGSI